MAEVNGTAYVFSAARMAEIEAASIVEGEVNIDGDLLLKNFGGDWTNAGHVRGAPGTDATAPIASVLMTAASTAPSGYLLCDGTAVSRTTYAALFAIIGTTYGTGDGSTTFNVPNLKGRVPVGRDAGQTEFDTLAETGGTKTHTLTSAEMPSHTHVQNAHTHVQDAHTHVQASHSHKASASDATEFLVIDAGGNLAINGTQRVFSAAGTGGYFAYATSPWSVGENAATASHTATNNNTTAVNQSATAVNQNTGGGGAHNNLQPYIVMNYIIKY